MGELLGYKRFVTNTALIAVTTIILVLISYATVLVLSRNLGPFFYGVYSQIKVAVSLLAQLATLSLGLAFIRFFAGEKDGVKIKKNFFSIIFIVLAISLIFAFIFFLASPFLARYATKEPTTSIFFKLAAVLIILRAINVIEISFFEAFRKVKEYAIFKLVVSLAELFFTVLALYAGYSLLGVLIALIVADFLLDLIIFIVINKYTKTSEHLTHNYITGYLKDSTPLLHFSTPLMIGVILAWLVQFSDQYIIGFFLGASAVGIYSISYSLSFLVKTAIEPLQVVLNPTLSALWSQNCSSQRGTAQRSEQSTARESQLDEVSNYLFYAYKYTAILVIPIAFFLSFFSDIFINLIATKEFSSTILPILALAQVFYSFYLIIGQQVLLLLNKTKLIRNLLLVGAVINIIVNIILVPLIGIIGAAISTLATFVFITIASIYIAHKHIKLVFMPALMTKIIFLSLAVSLFIRFLKPASSMEAFIYLFVGSLVYLSFLLILNIIKREELVIFSDLIKKKIRGREP